MVELYQVKKQDLYAVLTLLTVTPILTTVALHIVNNSGEISGKYAGGICGYEAENFTITNCNNSGDINADYAGGICGCRALNGTIQYCWNTGDINQGSESNGGGGGICGLRAGEYDK